MAAKSGTWIAQKSPVPTASAGEVLRPGYFVLSFDTELAWGYFDKEGVRDELFSPDGSREREAITRLLALCDEFEVSATWALVGHLARSHEDCARDCPVHGWRGHYSSYGEIAAGSHLLWSGQDVIEQLVGASDRHEIAFHGFSHSVFDESTMSRQEAEAEVDLWRAAFAGWGLEPKSVVFPRNQVGYLDIFEAQGFSAYRSVAPEPYGSDPVGLLAKYVGHLFALSVPPVHELRNQISSGLVDVAASMEMFGFNRTFDRALDRVGLQRLRMHRAVRAVRRAGRLGGTMHLWAHPWEFQDDKDIDKLRSVLEVVAVEREGGRLKSVTMAQRAELARTETPNT